MRLTATDKKIIAKMEEKIRKDLAANYSIADLAQWAGMGASKLKRGFYIIYGKPIHQYMLQQKMTFAHEKIIEDELTLTQIARLCGYRHSTNFIAAFKKIYGYTPGKLREKM